LGGGIFVFIVLAYLLDFRPIFKKITFDRQRIASLIAENDTYRREILHFKKPTRNEVRSWEILSAYLRKRIPKDQETLLAARLLAEKAAQNHLMDVSIRVPTSSAASPIFTQIAGKRTSVAAKRPLTPFKIHTFRMEINYVSSLKKSLSFLDEIETNSVRYLELTRVKIMKDFPFIRTSAIIRFYYGGHLSVKE